MFYFPKAIAIALCIFSAMVAAEPHNFLQINWIQERPKDESEKPSGFGLLGRYDFLEHFFFRVEAEVLDDDDVEVQGAAAALAYMFNPHDELVIHLAAVLEQEREVVAKQSEVTEARGIELGLHVEINESLMLHGELASMFESAQAETELAIGMLFSLNQPLGLNLEWSADQKQNQAIELGLRYSFR